MTLASFGAAALPISQQFVIVIVGPPVMAALWWMVSRGYGEAVQGGSVSERTKSRQRRGFWIVLGLLYLVGFAILLYALFRGIS